jgi:anaerobic ribonucleoside-triphosphate reductase
MIGPAESVIVGTVTVAIIGVLGTIYTARTTRAVAAKQATLELKKVESEAYERAEGINETVLKRLQTEIERVEKARDSDRQYAEQERDKLAQAIGELERKQVLAAEENVAQKRKISTLERTVRSLKKIIREAGLSIPDDLTSAS